MLSSTMVVTHNLISILAFSTLSPFCGTLSTELDFLGTREAVIPHPEKPNIAVRRGISKGAMIFIQ